MRDGLVRVVGPALLVLTLSACDPRPAPVAEARGQTRAPAEDEAVRELHALFDADWERRLRESPVFASYLGDPRYSDRWDDLSLEAIRARHAADGEALAALLKIDRAALPPAEQLNYELFRRNLESNIESFAFNGWMRPVDQRHGIQTAHELAELLRFDRVKAYEDWIARLRSFGTAMDQTIALMRAGIEAGRMYPKAVMSRVPAQIDQQLVATPDASPFYAPFQSLPDRIPQADRERLQAAAQEAIRASVLPAFERFKTFFTKDYLPSCPDAVGLSAQSDGADYYAWLARDFTTTRLTPDEIHQIGLDEVGRIRLAMEAIRLNTGFTGDLAAFFTFLRSDPRFFYTDGQQLLDAYRVIAKKIDPELTKLFGTLPRLPYGVRPVPDLSAPDTTTAYYHSGSADGTRAGYFYANLYRPESRPKWEMEALTAHEAVPGHHLQIAIAQELGEVPNFRKHGLSFTAFVEGWGLYSESLGDELGLYRDPYSKFGQLTYEMWRAVRLVVDTGLHAKGWSRDRAIDYFKANAPKSELDIVNEIDRYLVMPGQALAYKIGELKIKQLRADAEAALGEQFDVRQFHDLVLGSGAIPLDLLEANVKAWVAARGGG